MDKWITVKEAAEICGLSYRGMLQALKSKYAIVEDIKPFGKLTIMVSKDFCERYMSNKRKYTKRVPDK